MSPASLLACVGAGGPSAGGSAFTPASLAGLQLWLQADVGVYQDTARTTPATATNDPVGGWADQSGNARHLSQATSGKRPTLQLAVQNGRNIVRFDGVDDFLDAVSKALTADAAFTAFLVHKTSGDNIWVGGDLGVSINNQFRIGQGGTYTISLYDGGNNPTSLTAVPARSTWTQAEYQNGPHFWINGATRDNGGTIGAMTAQRFFIDFTAVSAPVNGDVGEVIIYNTTLNSTDRVSVESYLQARWAL